MRRLLPTQAGDEPPRYISPLPTPRLRLSPESRRDAANYG